MHRVIALLFLLMASVARAELPALVPREVFFGNSERSDPQISPDGAQLSWLAPDKNGVVNVWASATDGAKPHRITNESHQPVRWYFWAPDWKAYALPARQ